MTTTEFPIDPDANEEGLGSLFISDARVLIRPAVPGQYPASVKHDSGHAYGILCLGNDMGAYTTHIICPGDPQTAYQMLDRVFYAYVDACCLQLRCDARVCYIVDGNTVKVKEHGFEDGQYTMVICVHCGVAEDQIEEFLAQLIDNEADDNYVVVRPDSSVLGYNAHGFKVEHSNNDEWHEEVDDDGSCTPIGGHFCPAWRNYEDHKNREVFPLPYPPGFHQ